MQVNHHKTMCFTRTSLIVGVFSAFLMVGCSKDAGTGPAIAKTVDWGGYVPKSIPVAKTAPSHQKFVQKEMRWLTSLLLETYEKQAVHGSAWDAKAEKALRDYCQALADGSNSVSMETAIASCRAARKAGCDDPLLAYCLGSLWMVTGAKEDIQTLLMNGWKALEANAYPRYLAFLSARKVAQWIHSKQGAQAASPYLQAAAKQLGRAARDPRFGSGNQRIFVQGFFRTWGHSSILEPAEVMMQVMGKLDDLDPWIGQLLAGYALVDTSFKVRGSKPASDVPEGTMQQVSEHLSHADQVLMAAHKAHPEYPEAAAKLITIRMALSTGDSGQDLGELRKWFDASVAAQMDYKPAYDQMLWALRPRWGGSHEHMLSLGRECLETGRFDTGVPIVFWEAIQGVASETKDMPAILKRRGVTKLFDQLVAGLGTEATWSSMMPYWRSLQVLVHYSAGERDQAQTLFKKLGDSFVDKAFEQMPGLDSKTVLPDLRSEAK